VQDTVDRVFRQCPILPWTGDVWRVHSRRYAATGPGGSLRFAARWHRGGSAFPPSQAFATLYTAVSDAVATWEYIRHSRRADATEIWLRFTTVTLSRLRLQVPAVLDLRDPALAGLAVDDLTAPDYLLPQAIGAEAFTTGLQGLLVPTATGVGEAARDYNVIIFTDNLRPGSSITYMESKTPKLPT
jgi:RES domain-containing protein